MKKIRRLFYKFTAIKSGIIFVLKATLLMSLIISIVVVYYLDWFVESKTSYSLLKSFLIFFIFWTVTTGGYSVLGSLIIGAPVGMFLKYMNTNNPILSAIICGLIVSSFVFMEGLDFDFIKSMIVVYGFICGFAFMCGIKQGLDE